ncbi:hypothetical protein [Wolbachia endosymbiont of Dactylopius coccus]
MYEYCNMVHSKRCHSSVWAHNCTNIVVWKQFPTSGVSSQCPDTGSMQLN